ncbi:peptidase [Mycoplasmopsis bovigenitalium]|uniref:S8 family serine peptidase n=1 Tax=Mycoplasmopsis bovigenitalium TaxID=2112 RepID=UPI00090BF186|nr:S8 family serine peptidase [Mycoplasmopsis bovigenitalium]BAW18378.1 peptidase [Mycoplasmopsis bovigenitalium]
MIKNINLIKIGTIIATLPLFSASVAVTSNSKFRKTNVSSNIDLDIDDYNKIIKIYEPYYRKLGVINRDIGKYNKTDNADLNKVGIIELEDLDVKYLVSKDEKFKVVKETDQLSSKKYGNHAWAVTSIIGTDIGVNPDAELYFTYLNGRSKFSVIKEMHEKHNIKIFNLSLGYNGKPSFYTKRRFDSVYDSKTSKEKIADDLISRDISTNLITLKELKSAVTLAKAISYYLFSVNNNYFDLFISDEEMIDDHQKIDAYAAKNNLKVIMSSGNESDLYDENWLTWDFGVINNLININNDDLSNFYDLMKRSLNAIFEYYFDLEDKTIKIDDTETKNAINKLTEYVGDLWTLKLIIDYKNGKRSHEDNNKNYLDFDFYKFIKNKDIWKTVVQSPNKIQNQNYNENIIFVGSVDIDNTITSFSSYSYKDNKLAPLVSAYGNSNRHDYPVIIKNNKHTHDQNSIKDLLFNDNNTLGAANKELKNKFRYLYNFSGTSKSAPLITGLLSLLQNKLNREISLAEAKLLLSASSTYASKKPDPLITTDLEYKEKTEFFRKNRAKNKSGYGIPKFFKMLDIAQKNKIKKIQDFRSYKYIEQTGNDLILEQIDILDKFKHFTNTLVKIHKNNFYDFALNHDYSNLKIFLPNAIKYVYGENLNTNNWFNNGNTFEVYSSLDIINGNAPERKISISNDPYSEIERVYFSNYKYSPAATINVKLKFNDMESILFALKKYIKDNNLKESYLPETRFWTHKYHYHYQKNWYVDTDYLIKKLYIDYLNSNTDFLWYYEVVNE